MGKIGQILLSSHIENCVTHAFANGDEGDRKVKIDELMKVFDRYSGIGAR